MESMNLELQEGVRTRVPTLKVISIERAMEKSTKEGRYVEKEVGIQGQGLGYSNTYRWSRGGGEASRGTRNQESATREENQTHVLS